MLSNQRTAGPATPVQTIKMTAASAQENPLLHNTILRDGIKVFDQNHSSVPRIGGKNILHGLPTSETEP